MDATSSVLAPTATCPRLLTDTEPPQDATRATTPSSAIKGRIRVTAIMADVPHPRTLGATGSTAHRCRAAPKMWDTTYCSVSLRELTGPSSAFLQACAATSDAHEAG